MRRFAKFLARFLSAWASVGQNPRSGFRKIAKIRRTTAAGGCTGHLAAAAKAADLVPAGIPRAGRAFPNAAPTTANDPGARPSESRMKD